MVGREFPKEVEQLHGFNRRPISNSEMARELPATAKRLTLCNVQLHGERGTTKLIEDCGEGWVPDTSCHPVDVDDKITGALPDAE